MINTVFDACVQLLLLWAGWFGISYKGINVWIFVIIAVSMSAPLS